MVLFTVENDSVYSGEVYVQSYSRGRWNDKQELWWRIIKLCMVHLNFNQKTNILFSDSDFKYFLNALITQSLALLNHKMEVLLYNCTGWTDTIYLRI